MKERTFEVRCKEHHSGTVRAEAESMGKAAAYHATQIHADSDDFLTPAEYTLYVRPAPPYNGPWRCIKLEVKTEVNFQVKVLEHRRTADPDDEDEAANTLPPDDDQEAA